MGRRVGLVSPSPKAGDAMGKAGVLKTPATWPISLKASSAQRHSYFTSKLTATQVRAEEAQASGALSRRFPLR